MFKRIAIGPVPSEGLLLQALYILVQSIGTEAMHVTVVKKPEGYCLRAHVGYQPKKTFFLETEKTQQQRIFKSVESAFKVCRKLGFDRVSVEL